MDPPRTADACIGRRHEAAQVRALLGRGRLVTLTGPGGVGKTRLAALAAARTGPAFAGGVVFVDLTELRDGALLPDLVAARLGLRDRSGRSVLRLVVNRLAERPHLLVLDNCEHVVDAAGAFASSVLAGCPRTALLGTSRQSLGVAGEQLFQVLPFEVPPVASSPGDLARSDAVRLLVERASAVRPGFALTPENSAAIGRICRRLDGLPLAIELAAASLRSLSPRQLADRLARLPLPTDDSRLRTAVDWSYSLCSPVERAVWRRASVFAGSFDLPAAEQVCAGPGVAREELLDALDGLLDKSVLLGEEHGDVVRYRMLETIRRRGRELLDDAGERTPVSRGHRDWIDGLTAKADARWAGPGQPALIATLDSARADLRGALEWSLTEPGEAGAVLRIASRLDEYWAFSGRSAECRRWLDRALDATPSDHPDRPRALAFCALHAAWTADLNAAAARLAEAERLTVGTDEALLGYVRAHAAHVGSDERAASLAAGAAAAFRARGDVRRELHPLWILGMCGDDAALRRMLGLCESLGETRYRAMARLGLARLEVEHGDAAVAEDLARAALRDHLTLGAGAGTASVLDVLAWIADRTGDHVRAATLFGTADAPGRAIEPAPEVAGSGPRRVHRASTLAALGPDRFDQAFAAGRGMSPEAAARFALGADGPAADARPGSLTRRQWQVAGMVAEGLSNRDIAAHLVISQRTADTHVHNILDKLGFRTRAQIAAWFAEQSLSLSQLGPQDAAVLAGEVGDLSGFGGRVGDHARSSAGEGGPSPSGGTGELREIGPVSAHRGGQRPLIRGQ